MRKSDEDTRMNRRVSEEKVQRARLKQIMAALAEGERDIASGRVTTLASDAGIEAFFAAL
jgi:hypothetical protein